MGDLKVSQDGMRSQSVAVVATATAAVITLVVCAVLALLVDQNLIKIALPSATLSTTHILAGGLVTSGTLALVSFAIHCCNCRQPKDRTQPDDNLSTQPKGNTVTDDKSTKPTDEKSWWPFGGSIGAQGNSTKLETFDVNNGKHKEPLGS